MKKRLISLTIAFASVLALAGCVHPETKRAAAEAPRDVASEAAAGFSDQQKWLELKQFAADLNLAGEDTKLKMSNGGTSVYAVVNQGGRAVGAVIPENSATKLSGEIIAYNLGRAFGISNLFQPGVAVFVSGENMRAFQNLIPSTPFKNRAREENRVALLKSIRQHPEGLQMIFKAWNIAPQDYDDLVVVSANTINRRHVLAGSKQPVASFLKCDGPTPSPMVTVRMNEGTTTEAEAARQLSSLFLVDALTQQWDRFSGGNLQTITENGAVRFVNYDNGGTWGGTKYTNQFLGIVTRFDAKVAQEILDMDDFVQGHVPSYRGLKSEQELIEALGIESFPANFANFKQSLALVATHIRQNGGCFF